jgi:hypothetical protein
MIWRFLLASSAHSASHRRCNKLKDEGVMPEKVHFRWWMWPLHLVCITTILALATWGIESSPAGNVTVATLTGLAILPLLQQLAQREGKPWSAWRAYAVVIAMSAITVGLQYYRPPRWAVIFPLAIGGGMTLRHRIRSRAVRQ